MLFRSLAAVATEHGVTLPAFKDVLRHTRSKPNAFPVVVVGQPKGDTSQPGTIMSTDAQLPVMPIVNGSNPDLMDKQMDGYMTALVRLFSKRRVGCVEFQVTGFDADEPAPFDGELLQTGGVLLRAVTQDR